MRFPFYVWAIFVARFPTASEKAIAKLSFVQLGDLRFCHGAGLDTGTGGASEF